MQIVYDDFSLFFITDLLVSSVCSFCVSFPTFTQPSLFCRTIFFNALHKDGVVWLQGRVLTFWKILIFSLPEIKKAFPLLLILVRKIAVGSTVLTTMSRIGKYNMKNNSTACYKIGRKIYSTWCRNIKNLLFGVEFPFSLSCGKKINKYYYL